MRMLIDILRASSRIELLQLNYHKLKTYGAGRDLPYPVWKDYIYQMIQLGFIEIDYLNNQVFKITPLGKKVLFGETKAMLNLYKEPEEHIEIKRGRKKTTTVQIFETDQTPENKAINEILMDALRQLRRQLAQKENVAAYIIFSDAALHDMVSKKPVTLEAFEEVKGVGEMKLQKYGQTFVSLINKIVTSDIK